MVPAKWSVAIISTDYDLHKHRMIIAQELEKKGFRVLAFERSDFPYEPDLHSHDVCIKAVRQCDIALLLVDKRYGGLYVGNKNFSITEAEYEELVSSNKIILPFISKPAWDERDVLFQQVNSLIKNNNLSKSDARKLVLPNYVEKWEVLDFIEKIRKAKTNNWVITFDTLESLLPHVIGKLESISRYILQNVVESQTISVKKTKTTTGMDLSVGDVLDKGYYIPPPYNVRSGSFSSNDKHLHETLRSCLERGNSVLLAGVPGSGKSTLASAAFLDHAMAACLNRSNRLPFFLSRRTINSNFEFDLINVLEKLFKEYLKKEIYPLLILSNINFVWYLDGLDELTDDPNAFNLRGLLDSDLFHGTICLAARSRFLSVYCSSAYFTTKFDHIIDIIPWTSEYSKQYIQKFCDVRNCSHIAFNLIESLDKAKGLSEFSKNPLHLTLYLWIVEIEGMNVPTDVDDEITLYEKLVELMAKRDFDRQTGLLAGSIEDLISCFMCACKQAAWKIHLCRYSNKKISFENLKKNIIKHDSSLSKIFEMDAYRDLFDVTEFGHKVTGMRHEQLLEYLVARNIADSIYCNGGIFPECLDFIPKYEINKIIRALWDIQDEIFKNTVLDNLWKRYEILLDNSGPNKVINKDQVLYYIGRVGIPECNTKLRIARKNEIDILPRHCIDFGLMKLGYFDIEEDFYNQLVSNQASDEVNRGYHLRYYNDWTTKDSTYNDPENTDFTNTCKMIIKHFRDDDIRHAVLRRVEIFTLRRLIETRNRASCLTVSDIDTLLDNTEEMKKNPSIPVDFINGVEIEIELLKETFNKIN